MRRLLTLICLLFLSASGLSAQPTIFENVKIRRHRSADKRVLVDKVGTLTFDDSTRKVLFKSDAGDRIDVGYDDIGKVVFEVTTHMREGAFSEVIKGVGLPGLVAGSVVASTHVKDYWFYLDYKDHDRSESVLIDVPKSSSAQVINKAQSVFGPRVTVTDFPEKGAEVKVEDLKALKSKHVLKVDKQSHQVIAVNKMGTYSFAYLDPGKYRLVSQAENANGFEMELEGGHEYFFLQNTFQQTLTPNKTALSRNSPELATYLLEGSYFSDWKPKEK